MMPEGLLTSAGRPAFDDPSGGHYSEKTATFEIGGRWFTFPTVLDDKGTIGTEDDARNYVMKHGPIDPLTGEVFPNFATMEEAVEYAKQRSGGLLGSSGPAGLLGE